MAANTDSACVRQFTYIEENLALVHPRRAMGAAILASTPPVSAPTSRLFTRRRSQATNGGTEGSNPPLWCGLPRHGRGRCRARHPGGAGGQRIVFAESLPCPSGGVARGRDGLLCRLAVPFRS